MIKQKINDYVSSLSNLFFPHLCIACYERVSMKKTEFCISCEHSIPKMEQHLIIKNKFTEKFSGRIPIYTGAACYRFTTGGQTQKLIHQIKYHGKKEAATKVGNIFGEKLIQTPHYQDVDYIIPVPMYVMKERLRGFNQANFFADGLSQSMSIATAKTALQKTKSTVSQTKKGKMARWQNVEEVFTLGDIPLENKHVLLVDDVLTTGATLEACAEKLLTFPNIKISMATIAFAGAV
jgi:ComF family protein